MIRRTKDKQVIIACVRGTAAKEELDELTGPAEKTPTLTIPCNNGQHGQCSMCDCACHAKA